MAYGAKRFAGPGLRRPCSLLGENVATLAVLMRMLLGRSWLGSIAVAMFAAVVACGATDGARTASVGMPAAAGRVLWKADGESRLADEWAEYSTARNCAVTSVAVRRDVRARRVRSPVAKGARAYEFVVKDGDDCYGERSEVGQALPWRARFSGRRLFNDGDDRWISFSVYLADDFPARTRRWNVIAQWKQLAVPGQVGCCPMLAIEVRDGRYYLDNKGMSVWRGPAARTGRWVPFTMHIRFSTSASLGFVEIWGAPTGHRMRRLLARRGMQTLSQTLDGTPVPSHARIGIYRDRAIAGTAHLYYDGYTVAASRGVAEAHAFRRQYRP